MKNTLTKIFATSIITLVASTAAQAEYFIKIGTEVKDGGSLPNGSISFVTKPVIEPEAPLEVPKDEQPEEIAGKDFLYKVALGSQSTTASSYLFPNQPLAGSPLSCGDNNPSNCFVIGAGASTIVMTYQGTDANYAKNFPIGDSIIVKSEYFNTSTNCVIAGNNSYYTDKITRNVQVAYKCDAGSLPLPSKVESPSTVNYQFSISFYKDSTK